MWMLQAFANCGIVEFVDPRPYHRLWFLHRGEELYLDWLNKFASEIPAEEAKPGDIVIYKHGMCFSHAGMIIDDTRLIHAWFKEEQVTPCERFTVELTHYGRETPRLCGQPRPVKYFDPWKKKRDASPSA
jgi:cell wall-associated NlpC family hydrolase